MKKSKAISLLLCLSLLASLLIPGTLAMPAKAAEGYTDDGMKVNKTAVANDDGTYTITLEAYATGEKFISEVKKDVPTDIILVLDQSGSMAGDIGTVSFEAYSAKTKNSAYYSYRHNGGSGNLYYELADGSYASVSVTTEETVGYTKITNGYNNSGWYGYTNYWANRENLIAYVNGEPVTVSVERHDISDYWWEEEYKYTYTLPNGDVIATSTGDTTSPKFTGVDGNCLYLKSVDTTKTVYTYSYIDASGNEQIIATSTGANGTINKTLYQRIVSTSGGGSRLDALKSAVTTFANNVAKKAKGSDGLYGTDDDVNHRIAVVGFATGSYTKDSTDYPAYGNTEVFIGSAQYGYNSGASSYYGTAFQDMNTEAGYNNVIASKNALAARGATCVDLGIEMANGIFNATPVDNNPRNRVMVVFTDGAPSTWADYSETVAQNAIDNANDTKNTYNATVYTVGVFSGADATSAGNQNGNDTQKANWFMQNVSSNNGTPQTPSYYLSAADANTLNNIFKQISDQIESGGSSTTLDGTSVVKDIIAPAFALPEGTTAADITLESYACTGVNGSGEYTWRKNDTALGAQAVIGSTDPADPATTNNQVSVTGFDFAGNYVGTVTENGKVSYRGNKLVISFAVTPKDGFLGGNNVYTNTSAGIYENSSETKPVKEFPRPQVNVPIKAVSVTAQDKNVYLLGILSAADIQTGATVKCGDVSLDLSKAEQNYGLENWQTEYVDITVEIKDKDGKAIPADGLNDLTEDTTYTVSVTVAPKSAALPASSGTEATEKSGNADGNINVFKPVLTYKDSEVYYGDNAPTDFSANKTPEVWKHGEILSTDVIMIDTAPPLSITYTPEAGKIVDGKISTKQDIAVDATVKIGTTDVTSYTRFQHTNCEGKTCTVPNDKEFLLHVKTCQLTITKEGGADGEPYVFTVKKDGDKYSEVTIVGNKSETIYELPVGAYTIEEDTGWSWRYTGNNGSSATLSAQNPSDTITCTNSNPKPYWLNGYSAVVENVYGTANN